jgi:methyl-accepting chemotaxis protein
VAAVPEGSADHSKDGDFMLRIDINLNVNHNHQSGDLIAGLRSLFEEFMSKTDDLVARLESAFDKVEAAQTAAIQRASENADMFNTKITDLTTEIASLRQQIAAGNDDPVLLERLTKLEERAVKMQQNADVIDPSKPEVVPPADEIPPATTPTDQDNEVIP